MTTAVLRFCLSAPSTVFLFQRENPELGRVLTQNQVFSLKLFQSCSLLPQPELSNMSFEDVLKLQNKVGTRVYNQVAFGGEKSRQSQAKKKRLNKNR